MGERKAAAAVVVVLATFLDSRCACKKGGGRRERGLNVHVNYNNLARRAGAMPGLLHSLNLTGWGLNNVGWLVEIIYWGRGEGRGEGGTGGRQLTLGESCLHSVCCGKFARESTTAAPI